VPVETLDDLHRTPAIMYDLGSGSLIEYTLPLVVVDAVHTKEPFAVYQMYLDALEKHGEADAIKYATVTLANKVKSIRLWLTRWMRKRGGFPLLQSMWVFGHDVTEEDLAKLARKVEKRFEAIGLGHTVHIRYGRLGTIFDDVEAYIDMIARNLLSNILDLQRVVEEGLREADETKIRKRLANWKDRYQQLALVYMTHIPDDNDNAMEIAEELSRLHDMIIEAIVLVSSVSTQTYIV